MDLNSIVYFSSAYRGDASGGLELPLDECREHARPGLRCWRLLNVLRLGRPAN